MTDKQKLRIAVDALEGGVKYLRSCGYFDISEPEHQMLMSFQFALAKIGDINEPVDNRKAREFWIFENDIGDIDAYHDKESAMRCYSEGSTLVTHVREVLEPSEPKCDGVKRDE